MGKIDSVLQDLERDVSGFIATDVVALESGMSVGGRSVDPDFDGSVASAAFADVVKAYRKAFDLLDLDPQSLEDILGTADDILIITRLIGDRDQLYHGVAIEKDGNIALTRMTMKKYEEAILEAVSM